MSNDATRLCYYCRQPGASVTWRGEPYHRRCIRTVRDSNYE